MSEQPLPGEDTTQWRLRTVETKVDTLDGKLDDVLTNQAVTRSTLEAIVNSTALRESRASTLRVTLLGVAVAAVLTVAGAVVLNVITAAGHLVSTGTVAPTP